MFVNFSNHPIARWSEEQREAATQYGEIVDVAFPEVDPDASEADIEILAEKCVEQIIEYEPDAVMCQGEFGLSFQVVSRLKERGIRCVYACSKREVSETVMPDGSTTKQAIFKFVKFREF